MPPWPFATEVPGAPAEGRRPQAAPHLAHLDSRSLLQLHTTSLSPHARGGCPCTSSFRTKGRRRPPQEGVRRHPVFSQAWFGAPLVAAQQGRHLELPAGQGASGRWWLLWGVRAAVPAVKRECQMFPSLPRTASTTVQPLAFRVENAGDPGGLWAHISVGTCLAEQWSCPGALAGCATGLLRALDPLTSLPHSIRVPASSHPQDDWCGHFISNILGYWG